MRNILIVAAREFKQITAMRSFWLTLLILPAALKIRPGLTPLSCHAVAWQSGLMHSP